MGGLFSKVGDAIFGKKGKMGQRSTLGAEQQPLYQQLLASTQGKGAGGAFGDAADYYRSNLSNNPEDFEAFAAPEMRNYNENIIPQLSEQFAGMGSGGLDSSSFRNATTSAGTDLSERLAMIRAQLRQNSAAGLQGIGEKGLGNYNENYQTEDEPGLLGQVTGPLVSAGLTGGLGGLASQLPNWLSQSKKAKTGLNPGVSTGTYDFSRVGAR